MYPDKVQRAVRDLPQYHNLPSAKKSKAISAVIQGLTFIVVGVPLCLLAGRDNFFKAFTHMYIFFLVINIYDLLIIDYLIFCRKKQFRTVGTENMDNEYKDYFYHFKVFIRGIVLGIIVSLVVAAIIGLIG